MTRILGFNQEVADKAAQGKKERQRAVSFRNCTKNIKSVKNYTLSNPVLGHPALTRED